MRNPRLTSLLKWVSRISAENQLKPHKTLDSGSGFRCVAQNPRFFATRRASESGEIDSGIRIKPSVRKKAEAALLDYFYVTRGFPLMVAESMSKTAPAFLENPLKKINAGADIADIAKSISRYLWFHPINEFEPFFESLGLKQSEYHNLLPGDNILLNEDDLLLENHHILCNYGIAHEKIGKIYKEATEVFGYKNGALASKIGAYEDLGLSKTCVSKLIMCSPRILIGDRSVELANVLEILKSVGFDDSWLEESLLEDESYDWCIMLRTINLLRDIGFDKDELCGLIRKHPRLVFESSGDWTLILVGFQTKLGSSKTEIQSFFQTLSQIEVGKFVSNLRRCFLLLSEIEMKTDEICKIFRTHSWWLGTCILKRSQTLISNLNAGKRRICQIILQNPEEMKKWTLRSKLQRLPCPEEKIKSKMMKIQFLLDIRYVEDLKDMDRAFKKFWGRGSELRKRYDFIMSLGLNEKDVRKMVKTRPQILNRGTDFVQAKVDYLVKELGYPLSSLVDFPSYLVMSLELIKLRFSMYSWLKDKGKADLKLAMGTILGCSEKIFVKRFVTRHPEGPKKWADLKKRIQSRVDEHHEDTNQNQENIQK
ncbi:PREDICTED: transcription termination factor MTEF18, mitochondrial-like [Tarenaya hassleriana]|uniref:transcription termination factor MTEF18, mitochondrial-like n=1 Tax=Tarenaya hassleriana TaxID=28532 RepID=UPI00053C5F51|nr:PREDICTED: transcription termination factor MTEF18, mitochondrial-like [Tarenaya hassleriana]XP_010520051.1 PREDICTED: transcription termination factor MTEF18, mitochondrial-like [Tarenaya hassleriana]